MAWRSTFFRGFLAILMFAFATGCIEGTIDKPDPPDVRKEREALDVPVGTISEDNIEDVAFSTEDLVNRWGPMCGWGSENLGPRCSTPEQCAIVRCDMVELVRNLVRIALFFVVRDAIDDDVENPPTDDNGEPIPGVDDFVKRAEGFGVLSKICPGYGSGDRANPENGRLTLNLGFTNNGLDATLWGSFERCRYTTGALGDIFIDGDVVTRHEGIASDGGPASLLVISNLQVGGFGGQSNIQFGILQDFEAEELQIYLPILGGLVLFQNPEGSGYEDAIGRIKCNFKERSCTREGSTEQLAW